MSTRLPRSLRRIHLVALAVCVAAAGILVLPFWPWIIAGLWTGALLVGVHARVLRHVSHRRAAWVLVMIALLACVLLPIALVVVPLTLDAVALARKIGTAGDARRVLEAIAAPTSDGPVSIDFSLPELVRLTMTQGPRAWPLARSIAGMTTHVSLGAIVFFVVAYARIAHGDDIATWTLRHAPVDPRHLRRIASAFAETGRGLFFGTGGAALAQAVLATIAYAALGVPHAFVLGTLTLMLAVIPGGAAFVWAPVAAGLALAGRPGAALVLFAVGIALVSTIDNVIKPVMARYGRLDLPVALVFVSMLGGVVVAGPAGVLLGPLVVRVAKEVLVLAREERAALAQRRHLRRRRARSARLSRAPL